MRGSAARDDFTEVTSLTEEEDVAALEAIDRGIESANKGRTVSLDETRELIPQWISKFESRTKR